MTQWHIPAQHPGSIGAMWDAQARAEREAMFIVVVDGQQWQDADGNDNWSENQANDLADYLVHQGYQDIEVEQV